jgi:hypothetical protein
MLNGLKSTVEILTSTLSECVEGTLMPRRFPMLFEEIKPGSTEC